ncbi:MAG: M42 family metallopeptidase [Candidatus Bipolaricaulia bacterium]
MDQEAWGRLRELMSVAAPSGREADAARIWRRQIEPHAEKTWTDVHGNAFASLNDQGHPRVMLAGHLDQLALVVTDIDEDGFLSFVGVGRWDPQGLPGQRVSILGLSGTLRGVVCRRATHLLTAEDERKVVTFSDLWIDIGARSGDDARRAVRPGQQAVPALGLERLQNGLIVGSGLDDRVGAFVIAEALREIAGAKAPSAVVAVATVQEEVGIRGGTTSAFSVAPDVGLAVDVGWATDTPGDREARKRVGSVSLGRGPIVGNGYTVHPELFERIVETAEQETIPYQIAPAPRGTDANAMQISRGGVASALLSIPTRSMHSASEIVHWGDLEATARLLAAVVRRLDDRALCRAR